MLEILVYIGKDFFYLEEWVPGTEPNAPVHRTSKKRLAVLWVKDVIAEPATSTIHSSSISIDEKASNCWLLSTLVRWIARDPGNIKFAAQANTYRMAA